MLSVHSALTMDKNSEMLNKTQRFIDPYKILFYSSISLRITYWYAYYDITVTEINIVYR